MVVADRFGYRQRRSQRRSRRLCSVWTMWEQHRETLERTESTRRISTQLLLESVLGVFALLCFNFCCSYFSRSRLFVCFGRFFSSPMDRHGSSLTLTHFNFNPKNSPNLTTHPLHTLDTFFHYHNIIDDKGNGNGIHNVDKRNSKPEQKKNQEFVLRDDYVPRYKHKHTSRSMVGILD